MQCVDDRKFTIKSNRDDPLNSLKTTKTNLQTMLFNKLSITALITATLASAAPNNLKGCREGDMMCSGSQNGGFLTCNFNKWVHRDCNPGTVCQMIAENHPICNYAPKNPTYPPKGSYPPKGKPSY